ncbi:MAG TPA: sugar porter family MFS transporter [Natronoarchaeum rubrum]|nr:sugar porter family MFS transporter [Natronoarchaeum rubrum]
MSTTPTGTSTGERNPFVYVIGALAALTGLLFGFDTGVISGALLFIPDTFEMTSLFGIAMDESLVEGFVVSGALVGAIAGAAVGGRLSDRIGRRRVILVAAVVFFVGSAIMAVAPTIEWLFVGRVIDGVAVGLASMIGPLYISEIAPADIRGGMVTLFQFAVTFGLLTSYLVNYAFAEELLVTAVTNIAFEGAAVWRWMLGAGTVPAAALFVGMLFMPESPRWLFEQRREDEARDVLASVRTSEQVEPELREIEEKAEREDASLRDLLAPWVRPMLVVGIGLAAFQQLTGINTVMYYGPSILESTGFGASGSLLATVVIGVVNVTMTLVALLLIDRVGRRPLLLVGLVGMTVTLTGLGAAYFLPGLSGAVGLIAVASLMLYVAFFAIGLGPVFWLLNSEIYPLKVRGTAVGVTTVVNWAANLAVAQSFPYLVDTVGEAGTFWTFAALSVAAFAFAYAFVPETTGRSLEEIESDLRETALGGGSRVGDAGGDAAVESGVDSNDD